MSGRWADLSPEALLSVLILTRRLLSSDIGIVAMAMVVIGAALLDTAPNDFYPVRLSSTYLLPYFQTMKPKARIATSAMPMPMPSQELLRVTLTSRYL